MILFDDENACTGTQSQRKPRSNGSSGQRTPGFTLREMATSGPGPPDLVQLEEMFGAVVQHRVIGSVYDQFQPDLAACVDALINISEGQTEPDGGAASSSTPEDHATFPGLLDNGPQLPAGQTNLWDTLPPECQVLITNMLTVKDLAVASLVCTSMARSAALVLGRVDVVRCRCSIRSIAGMLRFHRNASKVRRPCHVVLHSQRWIHPTLFMRHGQWTGHNGTGPLVPHSLRLSSSMKKSCTLMLQAPHTPVWVCCCHDVPEPHLPACMLSRPLFGNHTESIPLESDSHYHSGMVPLCSDAHQSGSALAAAL